MINDQNNHALCKQIKHKWKILTNKNIRKTTHVENGLYSVSTHGLNFYRIRDKRSQCSSLDRWNNSMGCLIERAREKCHVREKMSSWSSHTRNQKLENTG